MNDRERIRAERLKLKQEFGPLFEAISQILFRNDPIGINFVSNTDEYEPEVGTILPRLEDCRSAADVQRVVYEEFSRWFGAPTVGVASDYEKIAEEIWEFISGKKIMPRDIDEYIAGYSGEIRERLEGLRRVVHEAAPGVEEAIKYGMPTFMLHGNLVYFAVYKKHIGFYPRPAEIEDEALLAELAPYEAAKSSIRLPFDEPVPYELIGKLVKIRVEQNLAKGRERK